MKSEHCGCKPSCGRDAVDSRSYVSHIHIDRAVISCMCEYTMRRIGHGMSPHQALVEAGTHGYLDVVEHLVSTPVIEKAHC